MLKPFWNKKGHLGMTTAQLKAKLNDATKVTANPELAGTEAELTGLEVGDTKYAVPQGTNVVANPTLAGTEADLTGLEVGDTKYKISAGGNKYYEHIIQSHIRFGTGGSAPHIYVCLFLISTKSDNYGSFENVFAALTADINDNTEIAVKADGIYTIGTVGGTTITNINYVRYQKSSNSYRISYNSRSVDFANTTISAPSISITSAITDAVNQQDYIEHVREIK